MNRMLYLMGYTLPMIFRHRSFFIASLIALVVQVAAIFIAKLAYTGMDCGLLERRICSFPVFLEGVTELVASINMYTLGIPTILLALLIGAGWRLYSQLRRDGMKPTDLLGR
ncbi:MAG: hypothetical protein Athens041674_545 [Parcubacteria group bacterium Athens0416_74]|nr:MAG: hypothetical protein Athens041674_545 [Parcubacteria group bacterium Athens0416_74]